MEETQEEINELLKQIVNLIFDKKELSEIQGRLEEMWIVQNE